MLINEYKPELYIRNVRKIQNLGNVSISGPHIVMRKTDAQKGLYASLTLAQ